MLTETLFRISFSVTGQCSLVPTSHWLQGNCAKINFVTGGFPFYFTESQTTSCMFFSVKIAAFGSLKRVTRRIFKISKLQRRKLKLWVWFFYLFISFQKIFISWHNPFLWKNLPLVALHTKSSEFAACRLPRSRYDIPPFFVIRVSTHLVPFPSQQEIKCFAATVGQYR